MSNAKAASTFDWTRYHKLPEIEAWLDGVLDAYPDVTEGFEVGKSYEGRTIRGLKISYKSGNPGVFIESNIHANEWITSATCTWFINELLSSDDKQVRDMAENHDWYIVPLLNVDGFVYSHEKVSFLRDLSYFRSLMYCYLFQLRIVSGARQGNLQLIPAALASIPIGILIRIGWKTTAPRRIPVVQDMVGQHRIPNQR